MDTTNMDAEVAYALKILAAERGMRYGVFKNRRELRDAKVREIERVEKLLVTMQKIIHAYNRAYGGEPIG